MQKREMNTDNLRQIVPLLHTWFTENARSLPWRERPLPYYVWVSEIMLQQTRVEAVKPFFARFIEALPDVQALASCPEDRLLKLWEGLGYYNRVRNMQKAAQVIMEQYDGRIPDHYEELLKLPGIGNYTAGAIASIAYGQAVPAVDGNVLRVISRITGYNADIMKQSVRREFEEALHTVMPKNDSQELMRIEQWIKQIQRKEIIDSISFWSGEKFANERFSGRGNLRNAPGVFNQALMELGATICLPNGVPLCMVCPVRELCYANEHSCQMDLPVKAAKKERRIEKRTVFVIRDSSRAAVRKRPAKGLLAGLYELPNVEGHLTQEEALAQVEEYGFVPIRIQPLAEAKHIFSHVEWRMIGYMVVVGDWEKETEKKETGKIIDNVSANSRKSRVLDSEKNNNSETEMSKNILFVEPERTEREYSIPTAFAAYVKYLSIKLGQDKYEQG